MPIPATIIVAIPIPTAGSIELCVLLFGLDPDCSEPACELWSGVDEVVVGTVVDCIVDGIVVS
jgi:hypothetical protein